MKYALARILKSLCYKFDQAQKTAGLGLLFGLLWVKVFFLLGSDAA